MTPRRRAPRTTIAEVAKLAGVSTATVSYVFSGSPAARRVSASTRRKVIRSAQQLNYVPNSAARGLRTGVRRLLGFYIRQRLLPMAEHPLLSELLSTAAICASQHRYGLATLVAPQIGHDEDGSFIEIVRSGVVDGLILAGPDYAQEANWLNEEDFPFIQLDWVYPHSTDIDGAHTGERVSGVHYFGLDTAGSIMTLLAYLQSIGHRSIGVALPGGDEPWRRRFISEVHGACQTIGLGCEPGWHVDIGHWSAERGASLDEDGLKALRKQVLPYVTVIVCAGDHIAVAVIDGLRSVGICVPDNVSVAGFGGGAPARFVRPVLTTTRAELRRIVEIAVGRLIDIIEDKAPYPCISLFRQELVVGDSTGPPPPGGEVA